MEEKLEYNEYGYLKNGVHSVTADEFITFFCDNGNRKEYKKQLSTYSILQRNIALLV